MTLTQLLDALADADIQLWEQDGSLHFSAPPGALLPQLRAQLSNHKEAVLNLLKRTAPGIPQPGIPRRGSQAPLASLAQQRLWLAEQLEGPSGLYNEGRAFVVRGALCADALRGALQALTQRHEVLRSMFGSADGHLQLRIAPHCGLDFRVTDLSTDPAGYDAALERALAAISIESQRPFDLARGPLLRTRVLRIDADTHVLGIFMHHIVCDGLSLSIVLRDVAACYAAACAGTPAQLPVLPIQYSDFALWQRAGDSEARTAENLQFWSRQLRGAGSLALPDLAGDRSSPQGAVHRFQIDQPALLRLEQLARELNTTVFTAVLACLQITLAAWSGGRDILLTTPVTERDRSEMQSLIGLFVNSLAVRQQLETVASGCDLIRSLHANVSAARQHQQIGYEQLIDAMAQGSTRQAAGAALSQIRFVYLEGVSTTLQFADLQLTVAAVNRRLAKFDFMLTLERDRDRCAADIEYKTQLFSPALIAQLARTLVQVIGVLANEPHAPLSLLLQQIEAQRSEWLEQRRQQGQLERRQSLAAMRRRAVNS